MELRPFCKVYLCGCGGIRHLWIENFDIDWIRSWKNLPISLEKKYKFQSCLITCEAASFAVKCTIASKIVSNWEEGEKVFLKVNYHVTTTKSTVAAIAEAEAKEPQLRRFPKKLRYKGRLRELGNIFPALFSNPQKLTCSSDHTFTIVKSLVGERSCQSISFTVEQQNISTFWLHEKI